MDWLHRGNHTKLSQKRGINPIWFRILFLILMIPGGLPGVLPYLLLWSFFVGSALMSATGATLHAMVPVFAIFRVGLFFGGRHIRP